GFTPTLAWRLRIDRSRQVFRPIRGATGALDGRLQVLGCRQVLLLIHRPVPDNDQSLSRSHCLILSRDGEGGHGRSHDSSPDPWDQPGSDSLCVSPHRLPAYRGTWATSPVPSTSIQ